jgi:hypothetical protein
MVKRPAYLIVGKGRWGTRMHAMLATEDVRADFASNTRMQSGESPTAYESRMAAIFSGSKAQVAWLCVPPGLHVPPLIRAAITAGLHPLVEKPWPYSREETSAMQQLAHAAKLQTAVHFEFCLLSEVEDWRREYQHRADLRFNGIFDVSAGDRLGMSAMQNLGSHLVAMHAYATPHCGISTIRCAYNTIDQRKVWLEAGTERVAEIDFLGSKQPIIQRFLEQFENSLDRSPFPFDFSFAHRVHENAQALQSNRNSQRSESG